MDTKKISSVRNQFIQLVTHFQILTINIHKHEILTKFTYLYSINIAYAYDFKKILVRRLK